MENKLEKINVFTILLLIIYTFVISVIFIYRYDLVNEEVASKGLALFLPILIIIYIIYKIINKSINKYEIMIFILIILGYLSTLNALSPHIAFWGKEGRGEGYLAILTYYFIFLNSMNIKNEKYKKIIIISILSVGILNTIYALFQTGFLPNDKYVKRIEWYAQGFTGNSNMFASLMSLMYPTSIALYYNNENKKKELVYILLMLILGIGSILTGAMSLFIGLSCIFVLLLIHIIKDKNKDIKKKIYKSIVIIAALIIPFLLINKVNNRLLSDILLVSKEASSVSKGEISEDMGTGRIFIWKNTIKKINERPLLGFGIDNFELAFDSNLLLSEKPIIIVDKAHNDYLQKMLCEGIPSGIIFIILLLLLFIKSNKRKLNKYEYGLLLAFTCYSIVAFFNISIPRIAPLYFIIMGILVERKKDESTNK